MTLFSLAYPLMLILMIIEYILYQSSARIPDSEAGTTLIKIV